MASASQVRMPLVGTKILQQLADQLGCGRRIRLVQGYNCVLDIIRRTAVMVNDCDLVDGFEQRRALHIAGTVYVHHDKQRVEFARVIASSALMNTPLYSDWVSSRSIRSLAMVC